MDDERKGHPSASYLPRMAACLGFWQLYTKLREEGAIDQAGDDADFGTKAHEVIAGERPADDSTEDIAAACKAQTEAFLSQYKVGARDKEFVEHRFWATLGNHAEPNFSAKLDFARIVEIDGRTIALVVDYKTLWGDHDIAARNLQLAGQVVALAANEWFHEAIVALVQPRRWSQPSICRFTEDDINKAAESIGALLHRCDNPFAPRTTNKHCGTCPCRSRCPEAHEELDRLAVTTVDARSVEINPIQMAALIRVCDRAQKVIAAIKARERKMIEAGVSIPGRVVKWVQPRTSIEKLDVVHGRFLDITGNTAGNSQLFLSALSATKTSISKALAAAQVPAKERKEALARIIDGCCEEKQKVMRITWADEPETSDEQA